MCLIGTIDMNIYHCVSKNITTDKVIITENQIKHINNKHEQNYESYSCYFQKIIAQPDYIMEANLPDTAMILKQIDNVGYFELILRLCTPSDPKNHMNSIITFFKINEKRWNRYIRIKKILYKNDNIR